MQGPLELGDMQRLLIDGLSRWPESRYALVRVKKGQAVGARTWLSSLLPHIALAKHRTESKEPSNGLEPRVAIAFTAAGFEALGLTGARGFLAEFRQGMATPPRRANLGDPEVLRWGIDPIHILLMVFSRRGQRDVDWLAHKPGPWADVDKRFDGFVRKDRREHFGFRDGISQPRIEGTESPGQASSAEAAANTIKPGEFVLGYINEAGVLPTSPTVSESLDPKDVLPGYPSRLGANGAALKDFGRNGSYLVFRQLVQDVNGFEAILKRAHAGPERERLAAKLIGRWRSGAPLVKAPEADSKSLATDNDFTYYEPDRDGHACPLGAHIRRANPRDSLVDDDLGIGPDSAAQEIRRHRIIRRGRMYQEGAEKGLLFVCLNANIQDQFEFVQHQWLNSSRFAGLEGEVDPLVGPRQNGRSSMTVQTPDGSQQVTLPALVEMVGGAYFFLPGLNALRCLVDLPEPVSITNVITTPGLGAR
ncbi:MAG TPA: hypothetical protein VMS04_17525 [Vicinamibacterales bacterium]|nr:hypothetical protein [Vicinamibacterales bacterium]